MSLRLNGKGKSHASSLIASGKMDRDSPWSFDGADGDRILGDPPDWKEYGKWFLAVDDSEDEETKAHYKYPFGKNGKVYRSGVIAAKQRASAQGETEIANAADDLLQKIDKAKKDNLYFTIRAQADEEAAEILLYGDIGDGFFSEGIGAKRFVQDLKALGDVKSLDIRINSPGGSVFEGLAIYNALDRHRARKTVYVDGIAASIASVIAMAGNNVVMPENAIMMIHDPTGLVMGDAEDFRKMAEALDKIKEGMISAYMRKTRMSRENIWNLMTDETWMTASEAVKMGFADETDKPMRMAAHFDLSKFKNAPKNLFAERKVGKMDEHEKFLQRQESEKERTRIIAELGKKFNMGEEALTAIADGASIEDFRTQIMESLQNHLVTIPPLDDAYRAPYGTGAREMGRSRGPFRNFGEQMICVCQAGLPGGVVDPRLNILNATGLGTGIPSEGGFLVQTDFSMDLLKRVNEAAVIAPRCWHVPIGANADGVEMPTIDETSRETGSRWGGIQVYRRGEADTVTGKKPKFGSIELRLEDLMGLCYVTNRMLKDAPSTGAIISRAFEEEMSFRLDNEIINGNGGGECLGILKSPALVQVSKETGQAAATVVYENLTKMFARMPARNRMRAAWLLNQEIEPQLFTLGLTIGMGGAPVYMPAGGASAAPFATLFSRPLIPIEQASALGTLGDIMFVDLNEYMIIEKGGVDAQQSIHVRFQYDESCFKFIVRNNGLPLWKKPLTPFKGTNTLSPFVGLQTRA